MNTNDCPVQTGPDYHCFVCGAPATGGHGWIPGSGSPLDPYARNIFYLRLPCGHVGRCVRVANCITPLEFVELPDFHQQIELNIAAIQRGMQAIAESVSADELHLDLAARIVFGLLKGELPPESALAAIRSLMLSDHDIRRAEEKLPF